MYQFFVDPQQILGEEISIIGSDVNHIKNVLRLGEEDGLKLCDGLGNEYVCTIVMLTNEEIRCKIQSMDKSKAELPIRITLFQGAPKQDKMELIVQKSVELGVHNITPVMMKRTIVKYDHKKLAKKVQRWQSIARSAAKQSKRGIIPEVSSMISLKELVIKLSEFDHVIIPYENEKGMLETRRVFKEIKKNESVAIIIGPEGGFDDDEINLLRKSNGLTISLGNRILRTETAGLASLAMIGYELEEA